MTSAFDLFMTEHRKTGSEKVDGYSRDAFVGLTMEEKDIVFKLLEKELPWSAEWLFLVDLERATAVAKAEEARLRGNAYEHVFLLQENLAHYAGDLEYQQHAIDDYPHYIESLKPLAVDAIGRMPVTDAAVAFFKKVILAETNKSAVSRAARRLLLAKQLPRNADEQEARYGRLVRELTGGSMQEKLQALAQVGS